MQKLKGKIMPLKDDHKHVNEKTRDVPVEESARIQRASMMSEE